METSQSRTAVLDHDDLKRKEEEVDQLREKIKIHEVRPIAVSLSLLTKQATLGCW